MLGEGGERLKAHRHRRAQDMERLFDGKVYLGVWVKVQARLDRRRRR